MTNPTDQFEQASSQIINTAFSLAPQLGWTNDMLEKAAELAGQNPVILAVIAPNGPVDILCQYFSTQTDHAIKNAEYEERGDSIRDRIQAIVMKRFELMAGDIPALKRGMGMMHHPKNWRHGIQQSYHDADRIWMAVGDQSNDYNRYTKRALLARILIKTMGVFIANGDDLDHVASDVRKRLDQTVKIGGMLGQSMAKAKSWATRFMPTG